MTKLYKWFALILTSMLLLFGNTSIAQTQTDTTFFTQMNYIFANLDKSKVPNGILRDFAMEFTNIENYNGTAVLADSNYADAQAFWDVYQTLLTGRVNTSASGFVSPAIADSLWYIQRDTGLIVLSGLYFNYSRFKDNAANNYITINGGRLYDKYVSGVWQNPYQSEQAFLLSPPVSSYSGLNLKITLPSNLWFTNNSAAVTGLQIDADDGLGYRMLTAGVPLNISYADTGHKEWKYKLTITGGATLYSHSDIYIQTDYSTAGGAQYRMMSPQDVEDFPEFPFTASQSYLGIAAKGYARIKYANPGHIRKPLIVVEGYDPGHILKPEEKFGYTSLENFLYNVNTSGANNLISLLDDSPSEYDIIYVDWRKGTDYLQRNAYLLETIIQWVNSQKEPLNGVMQPNVVLGQSMGGVIARYALKDMENNSINHQTRLYISDDAPHQGANVPQGFQHLARHARSLYIKTGVTVTLVEFIQFIRGGVSPMQALSLADQPASKQMLLNFVTGSNTINNSAHDTWQTELKNMGYPNGVSGIPFRKVAVSNGSECANPQVFGSGANLLTYNGKANTRILGDLAGIGALPLTGALLGQLPLYLGVIPGRNDFTFDFAVNAKADGISNQVYKGKITYTKKILWLLPVTVNITNRSYNSTASTLAYDYFPGGYFSLPLDLSSSSYTGVFLKYNITANSQKGFNFVPTVSALDIGGGTVTLTKTDYFTRYIGATPPLSPKNTPFDNFITAFNNDRVNEQHISIERRNGDWIAAELNGGQPSADCSALCNISLVQGDNAFCTTSNNYTIQGLQAGSTVQWQISPLGIATINSPYSTQTTLTQKGNGLITLTAIISNACGEAIRVIKENIAVGVPDRPILFDELGNPVSTISVCTSSYGSICPKVDNHWNILDWEWEKVTGNFNLIDFFSCAKVLGFNPSSGFISVRASNACGWSKLTFITVHVIDCSTMQQNSIKIFPNPASNSVTLSVDKQATVKTEQNTAEISINEVRIYDNFGKIQLYQKYDKQQIATINIANLKTGIYVVEVNTGNRQEYQQLIIQK